jgi:hypothetical protein
MSSVDAIIETRNAWLKIAIKAVLCLHGVGEAARVELLTAGEPCCTAASACT